MSEEGYLSFLLGLALPGSPHSNPHHYLHQKLQSDMSATAPDNGTDSNAWQGEDTIIEPPYSLQGVWWLLWMVCLEYVALWWQGEALPCLHDNVLCMVHATFYEITKVIVRGLEFGVYTYLWQNYAVLPSLGDSLLAVVALVVAVDLVYYWLHRASHEIMMLWAIHQVHHSSQDLTMAVGMRHSPLQRLFTWVFYLPLAFLGVPPTHMLAHAQFNLLYQCWIHTEAIGSLGPLEYVFNTPTHHQVHHASNKYCLDKNYGGVFIIWDQLFGTFQAQDVSQKTVYGILVQPEKFDPLFNQVFYFRSMVRKAKSMKTWRDAFVAMFKGPSWLPGAPWTGWDHDKPNIHHPREYRKPTATTAVHIYVITHFLATLALTSRLAAHAGDRQAAVLLYSGSVVAALSSAGLMYDQTSWTRKVESGRCLFGLILGFLVAPPTAAANLLPLLFTLYVLSLLLWLWCPSVVMCARVEPCSVGNKLQCFEGGSCAPKLQCYQGGQQQAPKLQCYEGGLQKKEEGAKQATTTPADKKHE
ncbi:alkylglycerol monooxygenase-like [Eriocheir sinensis]|uniref:alkylglycerol monooxygenase-like n=1 Tax=Eriocheir sinensis TaxID=95602 RepID=UPI0021C83DE9|nr:alkylglycerol monooxygenase-like [Eriocheir sinensis]